MKIIQSGTGIKKNDLIFLGVELHGHVSIIVISMYCDFSSTRSIYEILFVCKGDEVLLMFLELTLE